MPSSSSRNSCYFCGKREDEVAALVAGPPPLFICNECVALASDIIAEEEELFAQSNGRARSARTGR